MQNSQTPLNRRRAKAQLSCNVCRRRKLGCDRKLPCGTCSSRGCPSSCSYPPGYTTPSQDPSTVAPATIQGRLGQLEGLVVTLLSNLYDEDSEMAAQFNPAMLQHHMPLARKHAAPATLGNVAPVPPTSGNSEPGKILQSSSSTRYVDSSHWWAILDGIDELKIALGVQDDSRGANTPDNTGIVISGHEPAYSHDTRPELIYGRHGSISLDDVLAAMPKRCAVDRLLFIYFNEMSLCFLFIHRKTFIKQYHAFWENPRQVLPVWLGLLFAMMCLASQFQLSKDSSHNGDSVRLDPSNREPPQFLSQVVQCLVLGNYSNGGPHVIETLLHYFMLEYIRSPDAQAGDWLLLGAILRLAQQMGYHRDPSHFPNITPFQGEIRRRVWVNLYTLDVALSLQMGFPRMLKDGQWDTKPPSHVLEEDLDEEILELPPSQPHTLETPLLHLVTIHTLFRVLGRISDWAMTLFTTHADAEIERQSLDDLLESTYDSIPGNMKFTSLGDYLAEDPQNIIQKFGNSLMYLKGIVMLNRRHSDAPNGCVQRCLNAAIKLLEYQSLLDTETQSGGALFFARWATSNSVSHEFMMATVVLSSYMLRTISIHPEANDSYLKLIESSLRRSYEIWNRQSHQSHEASAAKNLLLIVFDRLTMSPGVRLCAPAAGDDYLTMLGDLHDIDFDHVWADGEEGRSGTARGDVRES